jgi:hypothetical protein
MHLDESMTRQDDARSLSDLIGSQAYEQARRAMNLLLLTLAFGWIVMVPLIVWATLSGAGLARALGAVAVVVAIGFIVRAVIEARECGRHASAYVSHQLGYEIHIGCYAARLDSWQRAIWRSRIYHESRLKRPRIVWSTRLEERKLRNWEEQHGEGASNLHG